MQFCQLLENEIDVRRGAAERYTGAQTRPNQTYFQPWS